MRVTLLERGEVRVLSLDSCDLARFKEDLEARGGSLLQAEGNPMPPLLGRHPGPEAWVPWFSALARTLKGGVPLDQALELLGEAAPLPGQASQLRQDVVAGRRFSDAVGSRLPGLPPLIPALLRAGEAAGDLARGATLVHRNLQDLVAFRRELAARLAYPFVVVLACTLALTVLLLKVFPAMDGMWANLGRSAPASLAVMRWVGWVGVACLGALAMGLGWLMRGSERAHRLPGFRVLGRHRSRSDAWSALAMALGGGVPLLDALQLLGERWGAAEARRAIQGGARPEMALASWVDDAPGQKAVLLASLRIGDLAGGAQGVADGYRELLEQDLGSLQRWLEPAVLLLLGTILFSLAWSLFSLMGQMEHGLR